MRVVEPSEVNGEQCLDEGAQMTEVEQKKAVYKQLTGQDWSDGMLPELHQQLLERATHLVKVTGKTDEAPGIVEWFADQAFGTRLPLDEKMSGLIVNTVGYPDEESEEGGTVVPDCEGAVYDLLTGAELCAYKATDNTLWVRLS